MARREALLETLADEIASAGGEALPLAADVTRRADVRDAVDCTLASFNRIDVLINSAGIAIPGRVETMPPEDLERMMIGQPDGHAAHHAGRTALDACGWRRQHR